MNDSANGSCMNDPEPVRWLALTHPLTRVLSRPTATGVAVGRERTLVSGWVNANHLTGSGSFMQLPFAESFMSASGGRAPRVVLVSYSEQFDSRYYRQRLRTLRSVDG